MSFRERARQRLNSPERAGVQSRSGFGGVQIHINELLLNGFALSDRYAIGDALQTELTRLLSDQGIPQRLTRSAEYMRLDGGTLSAQGGDGASTIGGRVANAVYRTFKTESKGGSQ